MAAITSPEPTSRPWVTSARPPKGLVMASWPPKDYFRPIGKQTLSRLQIHHFQFYVLVHITLPHQGIILRTGQGALGQNPTSD